MIESGFIPLPFNTFVPGMAEAPFGRQELLQTSYRPTIVIGLGGTGQAVVRRLKRLLRRYYRHENLDIFQFAVFDTTSQEVPEGEEPLDAGEFVYLGAFDAADMIRHLHENEHIAPWWPGGTERPYRPTFSGTGANRVRAVGRLVLFNYIGSKIIPTLETKIDRAIKINAQHGMGATSIKFYIVCSLAGGTGSAMVLDLAYITRMLGLRRQPTAFVTGVLVLDDAFLPKAKTQNTAAEFSANTYASLREINYFSATRRFSERYDDLTSTDELPEGFRPFDIAYLLGLHNAEGQALESFESLADMIAAEMMLEIASPLQGMTQNRFDNVHANERSIAGQPAAYSSFALSSLIYPLNNIASWCAFRGQGDFSTKVLLTPRRPTAKVETDVLAFTQKAGVEEEHTDSLIERLNHDGKGETMSAPALSYDQVGGLPETQLLGAVQRMEERALGELALIRETIAANVQPIKKAFLDDLKAEVDSVLRDPQRGPRYTQWFLSTLAERMTNHRDEEMVGEQAAYRDDADENESAWRAARDDLAQALRLSRTVPWRGRSVNTSRTDYATALNTYLAAAHQLELRTQAIECFSVFIDDTGELGRHANDLVNDWIGLAALTQERADAEKALERATETEYSLMRTIAGRDELEPTFERHFPALDEPAELDHLASQFWKFFAGRVTNWTLETSGSAQSGEERPAVQVYYFLADWYAERLAHKSLIERLKEINGQSWKREIELCYRQTVEFWNLNLARFGDKIRNNLQKEPRLVGYGEDDVAGWSRIVGDAIGENVDGVSNKNPQEMLFLKTSHGLPLFALRSANKTMRTYYQYVRRLWERASAGSNPIPVHISTAWEQNLTDIDPQTTLRTDGQDDAQSAAGPNGNESTLTAPAGKDHEEPGGA